MSGFGGGLGLDTVDRDRRAGHVDPEAAVLDLSEVGFTVERVLDVIPEPDGEIFRALANLSDAGLIVID